MIPATCLPVPRMPTANLTMVATSASACQDMMAMESPTAMVSNLVSATRESNSGFGTMHD